MMVYSWIYFPGTSYTIIYSHIQSYTVIYWDIPQRQTTSFIEILNRGRNSALWKWRPPRHVGRTPARTHARTHTHACSLARLKLDQVFFDPLPSSYSFYLARPILLRSLYAYLFCLPFYATTLERLLFSSEIDDVAQLSGPPPFLRFHFSPASP
jgi:hypothetical protein